MKIFILLARRNSLLFIKENDSYTLPYIEIKEKERIVTRIYNFMKEKFNINVILIIEHPWCLAFYNESYKILDFIPDFPSEVDSEYLAIPITSVEDPKDSFWIPINEMDNYKISNESLKIVSKLKELMGTEKVVSEFCG
jgi:hypothetical protein